MDSRTVNKLIRSEVWPILRRQGFSKFDSRSAWRYRGALVDVVNFQSFNAYLADGLGCTTFSFGLNLGVFLIGSAHDRWAQRDSNGLARPHEYECPFRAVLKKRTPIDGFERADIFYVSPDGGTMGPVMREVIYLLEEVAHPWFKEFEDLGAIFAAMSQNGAPTTESALLALRCFSAPGSAVNCDLLATLQVERRTRNPESVSSQTCLDAINDAVGTMLDTFIPGGTTPVQVELESYRIKDLLGQLQSSLAIPQDQFGDITINRSLLGVHWETGSITPTSLMEAEPTSMVTASEHLWPALRRNGFVEFTDRLAHRPVEDAVEVVSFVPMDPVEKRTNRYPSGLFRIGLGIFWPILEEFESTRRNRRGDFRPKLSECQLQVWLMPAKRSGYTSPTCFASSESALTALQDDAEQWFSLCRTPEALVQLLDKADWQILIRYPTMRGHGSAQSVPRALLRLALSAHSPEQRATHLAAAHAAVSHHWKNLQPGFRSRVEKVEQRFIPGKRI